MATSSNSTMGSGPWNSHAPTPTSTAKNTKNLTLDPARSVGSISFRPQASMHEASEPLSPYYPPPVSPFEPPDSPDFLGTPALESSAVSRAKYMGSPESQDAGHGGVSLFSSSYDPSLKRSNRAEPSRHGSLIENPTQTIGSPNHMENIQVQRLGRLGSLATSGAAFESHDETSRAIQQAYAKLKWATTDVNKTPVKTAQIPDLPRHSRSQVKASFETSPGGLPLWDKGVFDQRWIVRPGEMWTKSLSSYLPSPVSPRGNLVPQNTTQHAPSQQTHTFSSQQLRFPGTTSEVASPTQIGQGVLTRTSSVTQNETPESVRTVIPLTQSTRRLGLHPIDENPFERSIVEGRHRHEGIIREMSRGPSAWKYAPNSMDEQISDTHNTVSVNRLESLRSQSAFRLLSHEMDQEDPFCVNDGDSFGRYYMLSAPSQDGSLALTLREPANEAEEPKSETEALGEVFHNGADSCVPSDNSSATQPSPFAMSTMLRRQLPPEFVPRAHTTQQERGIDAIEPITTLRSQTEFDQATAGNVPNKQGFMPISQASAAESLMYWVPNTSGQLTLTPWNPYFPPPPLGIQPSPYQTRAYQPPLYDQPHGPPFVPSHGPQFRPSFIGPAQTANPPYMFPSPFSYHNGPVYQGGIQVQSFAPGMGAYQHQHLFPSGVPSNLHQQPFALEAPLDQQQQPRMSVNQQQRQPRQVGGQGGLLPTFFAKKKAEKAAEAQQSTFTIPATPILAGRATPMAVSTEWNDRYSGTEQFSLPPPALTPLPFTPGSDTMYPIPASSGTSVALQSLTRNGRPSYAESVRGDNLPFTETVQQSSPAEWGVVKLTNIPYAVTRQEVLAFLGRNAKVITPNLGEAVHITMERTTGKTMECFVEFFSYGDASAAVNKLIRGREQEGRHLKLGDRHVDVELSSQEALMKELFPRARNVEWKGARPTIVKSDDPFDSGFKGFLSGEDTVMMVKYAEQPHRFGFSQKYPHRTYECMISTLSKFPWHAPSTYTLAQRNALFTAVRSQILALVSFLKSHSISPSPTISSPFSLSSTHFTSRTLTETLLTDLLYAGLNCPGFSEPQRYELVTVSEWVGKRIRISPLARWWPFETLGRQGSREEDVVEFYTSALSASAATLGTNPSSSCTPQSPFGPIPSITSPNMTMQEAARTEWALLGLLLRRVFGINTENQNEAQCDKTLGIGC